MDQQQTKKLMLRQMEIVCNIEYISQLDIIYAIEKYKTIKQWSWILHDKDKNDDGTLKTPHYHIYLNFGVPQDVELVASWFELKSNFVKKVKGRKKDILKYHLHKNAPDKYQYSIDEVHTNMNYQDEIADDNIVGDFKNYSYAQMIQYVQSIQDSNLRIKKYKQLKLDWQLYCEYLTTKGDRQMRVMFIVGDSDTYKTSFAKWYCKFMKYDYALGSSSNDALQDYKGQKVLILDDLRDNAFPLGDLLKLLDNHTSSSVRSRYNNKVFNGDLIIITTNVPLKFWYEGVYVNGESREALARRISEYVEMSKDDIKTFSKVSRETCLPLGEPVVIENFMRYEFLDEADKQSILGQQLYAFSKSPQVQEMIAKRVKEKIKQ